MKNQKGMTLVEILVAMGLMVMVVFCFTPFMLSSLQNVQVAGDQRENLYTQKGDMEEQIAEGIDYSTPASESDNVGIVFEQNGITANGAAQGIYLSTADENGSIKLTSFLARDEATFNISPSSVSENCPNSLTIKITCDFITFEDKSLFALKTKDGAEMTWVKFHIDGPNEATMSANASYQFDISEQYFIWYGEDLHKQLRVTPSSMIAVGDSGVYYVLTSEGSWKKGDGFDGYEGKLGSNTLNDAVWTGTQYVAVGERGSWYYTEDGRGWDKISLKTSNYFYNLDTYDGQIYVTGKYQGWISQYRNEQTFANASEVEDGDWSVLDFGEYGVAVAAANFGTGLKTLWAYDDGGTPRIATNMRGYGAAVPVNGRINDLAYNGKTGTEIGDRSEVLVVGGSSIVSTSDGRHYVENGARTDETRVPNLDKEERKFWCYLLEDENKLEIPYDQTPELLPLTKTGDTYQVEYNGETYTLQSDQGSCWLQTESYFEQSTISIGGTLRSVAYGDMEDGGVWVVGGDAWQKKERSYTVDTTKQFYMVSEDQWEVDGEPVTVTTEDPTEPDVTQPETKSNILWRDASEYGAGEWNIVDLPENCPTINDIEFIGGKFYAVGDAGTILVSADGKNWSKMTINSVEKPNFNGIAGWGDDWGTDEP